MSRRFERSQRIRARASDKALSKVTRLFNASLEDILKELLQNARRSGATEINILLLELGEQYSLSVSDDGRGLDDPAVLLTLGESEWLQAVAKREDPAGMGFFSLANRGAEVHSNGWCVKLSALHFQGETEAEVYDSSRTVGTEIIFSLNDKEMEALRTILSKVSRYYPLPVLFEGEVLEREDFLALALFIEEWRGLRIGVINHRYYGATVNFHGIAFYHQFPYVARVQVGNDWSAAVDVIDCPELKLVLPARKEMVRDEFLDELHDEVLRVIYRYLGTLAGHRLPFAEWQKACRLGVELPEAEAKLDRFLPEAADYYRLQEQDNEEVEVSDKTLLVEIAEKADACEQQLFWRGLEKANLPYVAVSAEPGYRGYSWYDRLPKESEVSFAVAVEGCELTSEEVVQRYGSGASAVVDAITVTATLETTDGSREVISLSTDVFLTSEPFDYSPDGAIVCVVSSHNLTPEVLAELLEACYFYPSDEADADAYETQKARFQEEAEARAIALLLSGEAAVKRQIEMLLEREGVSWLVPQGWRVEIAIARQNLTVRVEKGL